MSKLLAGVIAALLVGVGVAAASSLTAADDDPVRTSTVSTLDSTGTTGTTERTGTTETNGTTTTTETTGTTGTTETGEDVSGPCDEAEHANDPRCTGAATTNDDRGRDDDRGRNRGRDDDDDHSGRGGGGDRHEDRSGSNSGKG